MAFVDNSPSFRTTQRLQLSDGGEALLAYCGSGIDGDTPVRILQSESGYIATALAASVYCYVGVPEYGSVASGLVGTFRISGYRAGVQGSAAAFTGTAGVPVLLAATSLHATATSTALGINGGTAGQAGVLTETVSASTTANMFLTGNYITAAL